MPILRQHHHLHRSSDSEGDLCAHPADGDLTPATARPPDGLQAYRLRVVAVWRPQAFSALVAKSSYREEKETAGGIEEL